MSFLGAVAAPVRQVLASYAKDIEHPCLLVGAGNFTVASVLRSGGYTGEIEACDVSLYTSVLGAYLSDQPVTIAEKADCPEHLRGLLDTSSPVRTAASVALLLDLREIWQLKNPFQERQFNLYRADWPRLLKTTVEKLKTYKAHIGSMGYEAKCGFDFLKDRTPHYTVFAFPPTYKRGYERLEKLLRAVIEWEPPPYREMTDTSLELYHAVKPFDAWFVVLEKDLPEVYAILARPAAVLPRGRSGKTFVLAKKAVKKFVVKKRIRSARIGPFWPSDRPITGDEEISFAPITLAQSIRLNELFLAANIDYFSGDVGLSFAFLLDGRVFGKADFAPSAHQWKIPNAGPMLYVMSDLAVASRVKKLSKLVLLALTSGEVKAQADLKYIDDFAWAITTAFSRHPVSMKYRGVFKLHTRKEKDGGYMLNYYAPFGGHGIKEALGIWKKRYDK